MTDYKEDLKLGMFVKCHIITDTHKNTKLITKKAVIYSGIQSIVFIVENNIAKRVVIDTGFQDAEYVEALNEDIKPGEKVITVGQYGLKDNTAVKIIN
jgi:membrane fusion protein (multidrug efflux system)